MDANVKLKVDQLVSDITSQSQTLDDLNALFRSLMKSALERMLNTEMDIHLGRRGSPATAAVAADARPQSAPNNRRNGHSKKTISGDRGEFSLKTPRDRNGTFEPQLIAKNQRRLPGFDEKILALYAKGMTTRDIQEIVKELYGVEVSASLVSEITSDLDAEVTAWQSRPLEPLYPVVFFDALRVKIRDEATVRIKAVYLALAVLPDGSCDILGIWIEQTEGAKFWMKVFTDLKTRGCQDILIAVTDGLKGMEEALAAVFPRTTLQTCIVHLLRQSLDFANWKQRKPLATALRTSCLSFCSQYSSGPGCLHRGESSPGLGILPARLASGG